MRATVSVIEVRDALACKFEMLTLVFANWNVSCSNLVTHQRDSRTTPSSAPLKVEHIQLQRTTGSTYLCTRMSAACNTGYENRPSFNLDLLLSSNGDVLSANDSLLCASCQQWNRRLKTSKS